MIVLFLVSKVEFFKHQLISLDNFILKFNYK